MKFHKKVAHIFIPFVFGYFLTAIYRTINAMLVTKIEADIPLSPNLFGLTTSVYFLSFALMQIPTGILIDHYGPRRVQASLFVIAGFGSIVFGLATSATLLLLGRLLIGLGMAGGLMAAFSANRLWFEPNKVSHMNNLTFSIGSLGAIASSWPTYILLTMISWKWVAILLGLITFFVAYIILVMVPDSHLTKPEDRLGLYIKDLKRICSNSFFWKITPLFITTGAMLRSLQSLWITPWLRFEGVQEEKTLSYFLLIAAIGMILGPIIASLLHTLRIKNMHLFFSGGLLTILAQVLIVTEVFPRSYTLWFCTFLFGFFMVVAFALLTNYFPPHLAGRVSTAINLLLFFLSFVFQYLFGLFVDFWGFPLAFWSFIAIQLFSIIWYFGGNHATDTQ